MNHVRKAPKYSVNATPATGRATNGLHTPLTARRTLGNPFDSTPSVAGTGGLFSQSRRTERYDMVVQTPTPPSSFNTSSQTRNKDDAADDIVRGMLDILRELELAPEMKSKLNAKWSEYKKIRAQEQRDIRAQDRKISDLSHKIYNLQVELEEERAENNQDADDSDDHL
jgi:hypothetical protein